MSSTLAERPRVTAALSSVIGQMNMLDKIEKDIIGLLPDMSDDQVMETRATARLLYCSAWKIEIACDAEIWDRTERNMGGRGQKDVDEKGILAAVNKRADDLGCSASTVYKNAKIYRLFKETIGSASNSLDEKGFYQAALAAPDPQAAIEMFADKRSDNPRYRVADAWRDIEDEKEKTEKRKKEITDAVRSEQRKALAYHIEFEGMPAIEKLLTNCPNAKFATDFWGDIKQQLIERLEDMKTGDARRLLLNAWTNGSQTEPELVEYTGLPAHEVRRIMLTLQEDGFFIEKPLEWKPDQARGSRGKVWRRTDKEMDETGEHF